MKNLIKRILKESEDEFEWVKKIPSTNIEVLGDEYLENYVSGRLNLTNLLNFLFKNGINSYGSIVNNVGGYLLQKLGYDKLHISQKTRKKKFIRSNSGWAFNMFFTSLLNGEVLKNMFAYGNPTYHDKFGEGGDEFDNIGGKSYASYFLRINGIVLHVGYDHRGTRIEIQSDITNDELIEVLKTLVDEASPYI